MGGGEIEILVLVIPVVKGADTIDDFERGEVETYYKEFAPGLAGISDVIVVQVFQWYGHGSPFRIFVGIYYDFAACLRTCEY